MQHQHSNPPLTSATHSINRLGQFNWSPDLIPHPQSTTTSPTQTNPTPAQPSISAIPSPRPNQSLSPRSSFHSVQPTQPPASAFHPLLPIGSQFNSARRPTSTNQLPLFSHPFAVGGSAQLLQSQPTPAPAQVRNRDPHCGSLTSSSTSSTQPDLDPFPLESNPSGQSAHSDPSSVGSPLHLLSSSPRPLNLCSLPPSRALSQSHPSGHSSDSNSPEDPRRVNPTSSCSPRHLAHQSSAQPSGLVHPPLNRPNTKPNNASETTSSLPRSTTTLWMGDLESWMDEDYVRRCVVMMGWHLPHHALAHPLNVKIKMVSGASPSSAYCFLTYPTAELAQEAWKIISNMPPTLMPGCERTFKLNWATGLPGVQPTWDREFSVFVRDLDREVSEGELVSLFTPIFPSTKSAKIMGDLSTGLSRGYAFIRFGEETDLHRALALGRSKTGTGMYLRGRSIKISEASGSSGTAGDHHPHHRVSLSAHSTHSANKSLDRSRHASLNASSDHTPPHDIHEARESQPIHRSSLPSTTTEHATHSGSRDLPQQTHVGSGFSQPSTTYTLSRSSPAAHPPHSQPPNVRPGHPVTANFRPTVSTGSAPPYQMLPFHRASVCMPPTAPSPANGVIYTSANALPRTGLPPSAGGRPASAMDHALPLAQARPVYPALKHMRNSIAVPGYIPEAFHAVHPGPPPLPPYQLHPGVVNMGAFYTASPAVPATGYYTAAAPNGNAAHFAALAQIAVAANHANNDPSNTTVFVGGLPACISEETLKTFFQNFGEITYVKIPPNKGCGFVQYVRRADAEAAMLKMHDFPIHGKSRIRLSWGRSLGDKQVEYVRKLSAALSIPFEAVWKIVEGQDHSTIKQIASVVGQTHHPTPHSVAPHAFHPLQTSPPQIPMGPLAAGVVGMSQAYAPVDHLVDPVGFGLQQNRVCADPARFPMDSHSYTMDANRYDIESPSTGLDPTRFTGDLSQSTVNSMRYARDCDRLNEDKLRFGLEVEGDGQDPERFRSASEHPISNHRDSRDDLRQTAGGNRLSFSSNDFYALQSQLSSHNLSDERLSLYQTQRPSESFADLLDHKHHDLIRSVDQTALEGPNGSGRYALASSRSRPTSPPPSQLFSSSNGLSHERVPLQRSLGLSEDLLRRYPSPARNQETLGLSREWYPRNDAANGLGSSLPERRPTTQAERVAAAHQNKSLGWSPSNMASLRAIEENEREGSESDGRTRTSRTIVSPPLTNSSTNTNHSLALGGPTGPDERDDRLARVFHQPDSNLIERSGEIHRDSSIQRLFDDQPTLQENHQHPVRRTDFRARADQAANAEQADWKQLEAEFSDRFKITEALGRSADMGWPNVFGRLDGLRHHTLSYPSDGPGRTGSSLMNGKQIAPLPPPSTFSSSPQLPMVRTAK